MAKACYTAGGCENTDTRQIWTEGTGNFTESGEFRSRKPNETLPSDEFPSASPDVATFRHQKTKNLYYFCDACAEALPGKYLETRSYCAGSLRFVEECWIANNQNPA